MRDAPVQWRDPDLHEVIEFLQNPNAVIKANAAAYLQHLCYMDDPVKAKTRQLGGIPPLVALLSHEIPEIHRNSCGALRYIPSFISDRNSVKVAVYLIEKNGEKILNIFWYTKELYFFTENVGSFHNNAQQLYQMYQMPNDKIKYILHQIFYWDAKETKLSCHPVHEK